MTPAQKNLVRTLRTSGYSCSVIAAQLGLSLNTVKSWECEWNPLSRDEYWTPEKRAKESARRSDPHWGKPGKYDFSKYITCKHCGCNYRAQKSKKKDALPGELLWLCSHSDQTCQHFSMLDSMIHAAVAAALNAEHFDLQGFRETVHHIEVLSPYEIEIIKMDGSSICHPITPNH